MYYIFDQNNSGGSFDVNDNVAEYVIIEANNNEEANDKAEDIGIYFNGVNQGLDCDCCGDRWYPTSEFSSCKDLDIILDNYLGSNAARWSVKTCILYLVAGKFQFDRTNIQFNGFSKICEYYFNHKGLII